MTPNTSYPNIWDAICDNPEEAKAALALSEALMWVGDQEHLFKHPKAKPGTTQDSIVKGRISKLSIEALFEFCFTNNIPVLGLVDICKKHGQPVPKVKLNFALDYDGCANSDVEAFHAVVKELQARGHRVYVVTMRYPSECAQVIEDYGMIADGIIPTSRRSKREACDKLGLSVDIWIDDHPMAVEKDAKDIWPEVTPEGTIHAVDHLTGELAESSPEPLLDFSQLMIPIFDPSELSAMERVNAGLVQPQDGALQRSYSAQYKQHCGVVDGGLITRIHNRAEVLELLDEGKIIVYFYQRGDFLPELAEVFGVTPEWLSALNSPVITNPFAFRSREEEGTTIYIAAEKVTTASAIKLNAWYEEHYLNNIISTTKHGDVVTETTREQPSKRIIALVGLLKGNSYRYTVQQGDTLSEIAEMFGCSVERLSKLNSIENTALIKTGESLLISR